MIELIDISKSYDSHPAIDSISLSIAEGEIFGLLGPNGAGKTTLIRIMCTLISPTSGSATINGRKLGTDNNNIRKLIGFLPETTGLYLRLSPHEVLRFHLDLHGIPKSKQNGLISEHLELVGLADKAGAPIATFSKGMKQRVALARALIHRPPILFLDEPTSGLDAESAASIREMLLSLHRRGTTAVVSTHNMSEAEKLCSRVAILKRNTLKVFGIADSRYMNTMHESDFVVEGCNSAILAGLAELPNIASIEPTEKGFRITSKDIPANVNPGVIRFLAVNNCSVIAVEEKKRTLEEIYLELVKGSKQ